MSMEVREKHGYGREEKARKEGERKKWTWKIEKNEQGKSKNGIM